MMKQEALEQYLARGWGLVPIRPRDKRPLVYWSLTSLPETPSADQVYAWFDQFPNADIGILTGTRSGQLVVVDIDPVNGGTRPWDLPPTLSATTPSGGEHMYYNGAGRTNASPGLKGVDVRGQGGLVVAPPAEGRMWKGDFWSQLSDLPAGWGRRAAGRPRKPQRERFSPEFSERILAGLALKIQNAEPGDRNNALFKCSARAFEECGTLGESHIREILEEAAYAADMDPTQDGVLATIESAYRRVHGE